MNMYASHAILPKEQCKSSQIKIEQFCCLYHCYTVINCNQYNQILDDKCLQSSIYLYQYQASPILLDFSATYLSEQVNGKRRTLYIYIFISYTWYSKHKYIGKKETEEKSLCTCIILQLQVANKVHLLPLPIGQEGTKMLTHMR